MMLLLLAACSDQNLIGQTDKAGEGGDTAGAPEIEVTPAAIDYGAHLPGEVVDAVVSIANVGDELLLLDDVGLLAAEASLTVSAVSPSVEPGASVDAIVTWTAGDDPLAATLVVRSNDLDEPEVQVPITGALPPGDLVIEPAFHDFGTLQVGASSQVVLTLSNVGSGPLTVSDWTYVGTDADLQVVDAGELSALPALLPAGASTQVVVEYAPLAAGSDEGTFLVTSDDPDTPDLGAQQAGVAEDDPCLGFTQSVQVMLTVDDSWEGYMDGAAFTAPGSATWTTIDTVDFELECGDHTLALVGYDTGMVISGVLAAVLVEGTVRFVSGPDNWSMLDVEPAGDWTAVGYDDSAWTVPSVCADTSPWGTYWPTPLYDLGAQWIWWTSDCRNLGKAWLRLDFTVP